ncbi:MAG: class I SAM-dependent methyltransferase [Anaerolineae bacterium]|nr:methyltransferase domain-containing protein [Anaerolineales bacterium]MCQ3975758.1 transcriptional regulator [Anaerolineae bacterium]
MSTNGFNQQIADAFTEKMVDVLNYGSLALMTSIGHRTGLFDTMATLPPATIEQIAASADLHERYVREWLGAMVVGRIIEHDPETNTYRLPAEHAAALTRAAAPNNIAAFTQYIGLLGSVEDGIVDSFRNGGGVPYAAFPRFQEVMAEDSGQSVLPALLDHILPLVPGLIEKLEQGIEVLDVGCGRGLALLLMAQTFPKSRFTGYDFSENGIAAARAEARQKGLTNLRFAVQDAATLAETERYDLITTFDAIHDQAKPAAVLRNIHRALKTDGIYLMQDIAGSSHVHNNLDHPMGPFLYTVSTMHCMTVSLAYNGEGLGAMWGREKALEMLTDAGFTQVEVKELAHDIQNHYYINRKG